MDNEIEKSEQPNPDDILTAIQSFNDPAIIVNMFKELNWNYSLEIRETLALAKQNANLSIKFKALKYLRELLREAAESAGYTANVSQTIPNAQGGQTTFSAKRMTGMLNPTKQIKSSIKESQNDRIQETETKPNRESDRAESQTKNGSREIPTRTDSSGTDTADRFPPERDSGRAEPVGDATPGGIEPEHRGETSGGQRPKPDAELPSGDDSERSDPCIETRPPTCNQNLYPGISSAEER